MKCTIKRRSRYVRVCRPTHLKSVARERKKERKERVESDGGVGGGEERGRKDEVDYAEGREGRKFVRCMALDFSA